MSRDIIPDLLKVLSMKVKEEPGTLTVHEYVMNDQDELENPNRHHINNIYNSQAGHLIGIVAPPVKSFMYGGEEMEGTIPKFIRITNNVNSRISSSKIPEKAKGYIEDTTVEVARRMIAIAEGLVFDQR